MSYAVLNDVAAYFQNDTFTSETVITDTTVNNWIEQDSNYIDVRISKVVDITQITPAGNFILAQINAKLTANKIDASLPNFNTRKKDEIKRRRNLEKEAMNDIKLIEDHKLLVAETYLGDLDSNLPNVIPGPIYSKETIF